MSWRALVAVASLALALAAAGCSTGSSMFKSSPFGSSSNVDRTFIGAAQTWDLDKNSTVTCDEWKQYASTSLREADGNGDGALTSDEYVSMVRSDRLFDVADLKYFDANSDGKVTSDELVGKPNRAFNLLDKNGDCQIDRNETVQVIQVDKKKEETKAPDPDQSRRGGGGY